MNLTRESVGWMFSPQPPPVSLWRVILWWELRRIPYNILVGLYGVFCLIVFLWAITTSGYLKPGEDAVEPMALLAAPFGVNICYTLGWLVEVPARTLVPSLSPRFGPLLMRMGIELSVLLISVPAVYWGGYRLLQLVHVMR